MTSRSMSVRGALLIAVGSLLILGGGCSSTRPSQPTEKDQSPTPTGPTLSLLYRTADAGLVLHDARRDSSHRLAAGVTSTGTRAVSPTGRYLAFSYVTADSTHLALLTLPEGHLQRVHARAGRVIYSLAWHARQDRLAFGHYRPTENGNRGPGAIGVISPGGSPRDIGCNAAREVLHWLPDGPLATRTDDNLYIVSVEDCATESSLDARRMYHIHYAPNGRQMAYIHRELRYDRSVGDYVPDSSLVLSGPRGEDSETLFGNERHVRHLRWAPDASELAFDVQSQQSSGSGRRQIVIYNGSRTVFLTPPSQTTADQVHPRWSPSGDRLAFTLRAASGPQAAVRVKGQTRRLGPIDGAVWGWLDERSVVVPGPDSLRIKTLNGTTRYTHPAPATLIHVWEQPVS